MEYTLPDGLVWTNYSYSYAYDEYYDWMDDYYWQGVINSVSTMGVIPLGLLANVIFLFVVIRVRAMHTPVNIHLSNLAVADMLYLLCSAIQYAAQIVNFATGVLSNMPYFASMLFVTAVAVGRCFAVYRPFRAREGHTKCRAVKVAVGIWLASVLSSVAYNLVIGSPEVDGFVVTLLYLLINPTFLVVNVALYASVIGGLWSSRRIATTSLDQGRMVFMLVTNTAVFFSFHIAATTFNLYAMFNPMRQKAVFTGRAVLFLMSFLNSSVNPLVYTVTNAEYRAAFAAAFSWQWCPCRKNREPQTQSNSIEINALNLDNHQGQQSSQPC